MFTNTILQILGLKMNNSVCFLILFSLTVSLASCNAFGKINQEAESCEAACETTYPLHTYPKAEHLECCKRGCRLFAMMDVMKTYPDVNSTVSACQSACKEAYNRTSECYACNLGCNSQVPFVANSTDGKQTLHILTPLLFVKAAYSSVANHVWQLVSRSWTVYVEQDNDNELIMESEPEILQQTAYLDNFGDSQDEDEWDDQKNLPLMPQVFMKNPQNQEQETNAITSRNILFPRWFTCVSQQSGLSQWLLVFVVIMAVVIMVWLCCTTTLPPSEHARNTKMNVESGDVGYLHLWKTVKDVKIQPPSDNFEAPPLPVKVPLMQSSNATPA